MSAHMTRSIQTWLGLAAAVAVWSAVAEKGKPPEVVTTEALGGKERFLAHVSTDKPIYRSGEKVYVRAVALGAADRAPLAADVPAFVQILGPKGETVVSGHASTEHSAAGFAWEVPDGQSGGEYTTKVTFPQLGIPPAERKFDVRAYRAPRIKTQIVFLRDGYGPGDAVSATLEATRAEGGAPAGARVRIQARVDGAEVHAGEASIDAQGRCTALFKLPAEIARGEGTLAFTVADGGVVETATKTIPILLQTVDLAVYPEGGDLVAGLPCRVYLEARTPAQKPADLAGAVVDGQGRQVGTFRTEHEGRGRFVFTPAPGVAYHLRIVEPAGIKTTYPLPEVKPAGTVLRATADVFPRGEPIRLQVLTTARGPFKLTLSQREVEVAALRVRGPAEAGREFTADAVLTPPAAAAGVLVATVWDADGLPVAERLIFREPALNVRVKVEADRTRYVPAGKVALTVTTTDDEGYPVEAVVGLAVTDDSVLELIEKREQAPRLPAMALLEPEVRELADADVYLDAANPKAALATDLLLGTQGWRRFALVRATDFMREHGDKARRALAFSTITAEERAALRRPMRGGARMFKGAVEDEGMVMDGMPVALAAAVPEGAPVPALAPAAPPPPAAAPVPPAEPQGAAKPAARADKDPLREALEVGQKEEAKARLEFGARAKVAADADREMLPWVVVREYAHPARPGRQPGERTDFTETLYWHAGLKTDAKTGKATVRFDLNDAVTSFRATADAYTGKGALGTGTALVESVQPFYAEPKLPLEVTMGDRIRLPVGVVNGTLEPLAGVALKLAAVKGLDASVPGPFALPADGRVRQIVDLAVGDVAGTVDFALDAAAGPYADHIVRPLRIVPRGFPVEIGEGGLLTPGGAVRAKVKIPATVVPGSVRTAIAVYPSPLANLTEALERLIQEPCGCFEQTSSTTYPLVMAQQYFLSHQGVDPQLIARSRELLAKGYQRLLGFECKQKGYEWFGEDPGHEALTAYGLLEFTDMAKVHSVDSAMLARTRAWLLGTRDGQGGFKRERRALHTWVADKDISNAYIVWSLLCAGEPAASLAKETATVLAAAQAGSDSYLVALAANVAWLAGDKAAGKALSAKLAAQQGKGGEVAGAATSIVGSGGDALAIETTALAVLAWLNEPAQAGQVEKGMQWLAEACKAGRYGSTQSTVLALRAIVAYDAARARPKAPGSVQLLVDGRQAGSPAAFGPETKEAIRLTDVAELLEPGEHTLELRMTGGSEMPCAIAVTYADEQPDTSAACRVDLKVALAAAKLAEGGVTEASVTVVSKAEDEIVPMAVAIVGIPGGLEVRHDQLKELVKARRIAAYEVRGRDVVLYWRELQPGKPVAVPISLVAAIPGTYTGPASRAYLYYTDEHKTWAAPLKVEIAARSAEADRTSNSQL